MVFVETEQQGRTGHALLVATPNQRQKAMTEITLFEFSPTRSARCLWTLKEAGLPYKTIGGAAEVIGSEQLLAVHPLGKLPAALINGRPLFESAAISTAIADLVPERELIAAPGTWARALHDQWVSFTLTEMEAWLWSSELNASELLPKEQRVPEILAQNEAFFARSASVMDSALSESKYLVEDRFSVTDIIVGYTLYWAEEDKLLGEFKHLCAFLERLMTREHCPFERL